MTKISPQHALRRRLQNGSALIEALVAMVIFATGVLGLVGLQAKMTRAQTGAKMRADAAYLASELTGLMWADLTNITQYSSANCASYARCSVWAAKVASQLPSGTATVTVDSTTGDVAITISWSAPGSDSHVYATATTIVTATHA
jgi:type IV pilus assembly protein PilV